MKRSKMIEIMVAAVSALGNNEIADDLMEVASILEYEWTDEIKDEYENDDYYRGAQEEY